MFLFPRSSNVQLTIALFILFLNIRKSMNNTIEVSAKTHAYISGRQENSSVGGKSKFQEHIKNLKQVNGFKEHNILRTLNDTGPLIYINNPVEAKLPNAYLSVNGFKEMLLDRAGKLRKVSTNKRNIFTTRTMPFKKIQRGRILLKHIIPKAKPIVASVKSTVKLKDDKKTATEGIKKSNHQDTDLTTQLVRTTHLNKELNPFHIKLKHQDTDTTSVPVTTVHLNEELIKSHVKIIHKDIHRLENHHINPDGDKISNSTRDVDQPYTKPLGPVDFNNNLPKKTDEISTTVFTELTKPLEVTKVGDKITSIEVNITTAVNERKEEESSTVATEAKELITAYTDIKASSTIDMEATETSTVYKDAEESSTVVTEDLGSSNLATDTETVTSTSESTISTKRKKHKKRTRPTLRTLGRPMVFGV